MAVSRVRGVLELRAKKRSPRPGMAIAVMLRRLVVRG